MNWLRPGRHWVLKWPYHLWHLDTLAKTFPDAVVIHLHRDPREAIPSGGSLAAAARAPFCESIDDKALGKFWLDYCETGLQRGLKARDKPAKNQVIDIRYSDLKQNPLSVIYQIRKVVNLAESEAWTKNLNAETKYFEKKVSHHHRYSAAQFDLDPDEIHERFAGYIKNYDLSAR